MIIGYCGLLLARNSALITSSSFARTSRSVRPSASLIMLKRLGTAETRGYAASSVFVQAAEPRKWIRNEAAHSCGGELAEPAPNLNLRVSLGW